MTAISLGGALVADLPMRADGGYYVEPDMGVSVYNGVTAQRVLATATHFDCQTQIAIPVDAHVTVTVGENTEDLAEPGVVLLQAGAEAQVQVLTGNVVVITTQQGPEWWQPYGGEALVGKQLDGYNTSGLTSNLAMIERGVFVYRHSQRADPWCPSGGTEWITDSVTRGPREGVYVGISHVYSGSNGLMPITEIHHETLHKHYRLTEVYLPTRGRLTLVC